MTPYEQKSFSYRFASFLVDHPLKAMSIAIVIALALIPGLQYLETDFSYRIWFRETDPMLARFDEFERQFGNDETVIVIMESESGIFDESSIEVLQELTEDLWLVDEIIRVDSLSNFNWTHSEEDDLMVEPLLDDELEWTPELIEERKAVALNHESIPGYLLSSDAKVTVIFMQLKPAIGGTNVFEDVVNGTREMVAKYEGRDDHTFYITGPAAITQAFKEITQSDLQTMVPMLLLAILIFLVVFFRNLAGVLLPFMVIFSSIFITLGFSGWIDIDFNNLTSIIPNILIAISVADAVHILVTFYQMRATGLDRKVAAQKTLVKNLQPTLLTSISTAIGFFSFSSAKIMPIVAMGILAGTGTLIAWVITIFLLAPMLAYLPSKIKKTATVESHDKPHPLALRYTHWLAGKRKIIIPAFALATIGALYLGMKNEINSDPFKYFAEDVPLRIANDFAEERVGGMSGIEMVIDSGTPDGAKDPVFLKKVDEFQKWVDQISHISKTVAITDIIKQSNRALNGDMQEHYIIPDNQELVAQEIFLYTMSLPQGMDLNNRITLANDKIRLTAMSEKHDSKFLLTEFERMEAKGRELGLNVEITGKLPLYQRMNPYVVNAFIVSISLALVMVSILMLLVFRNWKLGLLSMVPNTVPLIFGGAIMYMLGKPLDIGTVLVTSTCLGIAVDDTIHFLSNYNRWRRLGVSAEEAVAQVITYTGPALFVTTVILVAAFSTFAFSAFVPNINFGVMTAIILVTALVTDFTLLPAMLVGREQPATASADVEAVAAA